MTDEITALFRLGIGPWLTPLRGKIPTLDAWQQQPPVDEATVRDWLESGYNLGFRTGARSGLVVIDDDQPRSGGGDYVPPETALIVATPTGGKHYYYRCPTPAPRNSASVIAPHVDVRGEGGQVAVPPSVHPTARAPYRWESMGDPGAFPELVQVDMTKPAPTRQQSQGGYAEVALTREVARVRASTEGTRNDTLNRAAFNLGQLVAGGELPAADVRNELEQAAAIAGLEPKETEVTINSGFRAGAKSPRSAPQRTATITTRPQDSPNDVLVPGSHVLDGGEYVEQGTHSFAHQVFQNIAPGALYRRASTLGEINDGQFVQTPPNRLRTIVDRSMRLVAGKPPKTEGDEPTLVYRTCTRDHASVLFDYGTVLGDIRTLRHLATYPVCTGADFTTARPGWNEDDGVYLAFDELPEPLDIESARAVLEDLVCDFPFAEPADRANFFGLLLTPILRPAINEPVPMHLIGSPMERTGKTKLAEIVLGVTIAGRRTPAMQLGEREDEREKRILSVLLRGQGLLHLDNLRDFLDSPALASLLTSSEYQGRLLGSSIAPTIPNGLTVVGTGNNVHATGEIAKRIVPIRLLPASERPETRTDFRHPDLLAFVTQERPRILGALLGILTSWRAAGRPLCSIGFGGFERWTSVVGGIMQNAGYDEWLSNMDEWRQSADDSGQEHAALVTAWHAKYGKAAVVASQLYDLATELDIYGWLERASSERARRTSFGMRVLNRLNHRVMSLPGGETVRVLSDGVGKSRKLRLERVGPPSPT